MKEDKPFFDTNILLYLLSQDERKADRAEFLLAGGGFVSVQALNEIASVSTRKLKMTWVETREVLSSIRGVCKVLPLTTETHEKGLFISERYGFSVYDAMIAASALLAGCRTLFTEDLQNGQLIENKLAVCNPFIF